MRALDAASLSLASAFREDEGGSVTLTTEGLMTMMGDEMYLRCTDAITDLWLKAISVDTSYDADAVCPQPSNFAPKPLRTEEANSSAEEMMLHMHGAVNVSSRCNHSMESHALWVWRLTPSPTLSVVTKPCIEIEGLLRACMEDCSRKGR